MHVDQTAQWILTSLALIATAYGTIRAQMGSVIKRLDEMNHDIKRLFRRTEENTIAVETQKAKCDATLSQHGGGEV